MNTSGRNDSSEGASDIEEIGVAVLERVRLLAGAFTIKSIWAKTSHLSALSLPDTWNNMGPKSGLSIIGFARTISGTATFEHAFFARPTTRFTRRKKGSRTHWSKFAIRRRIGRRTSRNSSICCTRMMSGLQRFEQRPEI